MYTYSSEVRWFFPGMIREGDALLAWFAKPLNGYIRDPKCASSKFRLVWKPLKLSIHPGNLRRR